MNNRKTRYAKFRRAGLTIMEVMFAIGVILIGLLGLAGLIPVAVRYAGDTIRFDEAIQSGASASAMTKAVSIADFDRLLIAPTAAPTPRDLDDQSILDELDGPGYEELGVRTGRFAGFCIDPVGILAGPLSSSTSAYSTAVFPYYKTNWNPSRNPSDAWGGSETISIPMPRLWRCQLRRTTEGTAFDTTTAQSFFSLSGNPAKQEIKDRSLFGARFVTTSGTSPFVAPGINRFSWFATLTPGFDKSPAYTLSTVIIDGRVPFISSGGPAGPATRAEDNESSERLAWVTGLVGFEGGAGGDAMIVGSSMVSDKVRAGQWVMLSRQDFNTTVSPPVPFNIPAQHAWYRIVSVSDVTNNVTMPTGGTGWSRTLTLDGPDWQDTTKDAVFHNDPICTIVEDAVEVIQTTVFLN